MSVDGFLFDAGRKMRHEEWKGSFEDYLNMAIKNPTITQLSTERIYNMILSHGTKEREDGSIEYGFFKNRIFGSTKQIDQLMMYLKAASMGLDIKKRVVLLLGPPGGGKSMILGMIKKGLASYSRTQEGAVYAIDSCPINEDPMHLIPEGRRGELRSRYGIRIEGKLCPWCQFRFENEWNLNLNNVPVRRIYLSEENRIGIGTFAPAERNDMDELYGSADLSKLEQYGNAGDVRAYDFNGELHTANRGLMEFIEVLKAKPEFLHILLTLAEEQMFKTPRFPLQYVDELLIAHTNEGEFLRFIGNRENEAIIDRFHIIKMPYNMREEDEEQIYHSALKSKLKVDNMKIHPGGLRLASEFVIRTRQHENELRVGMGGISPRFILNTIALAFVSVNKPLITPKDFYTVLCQQIHHYPILTSEKRDEYMNYLRDIGTKIHEYEEINVQPLSKSRNSNHTATRSSMFDDLILGD
ncbi:protein prkA (plasmid) [Pontibacillus sp. ALD_SL1]|uniref:hypothetical protein n=1 Tax=Pontibacillus sp. ALD_SL1 TaxID=2777185 RepID=UPI001A95EB81|nr:hypothetical protein [Pontibacillus sp. ALD_SL1]QST02939.1 protein prkA [Pontibacillus sp. ALD_SL1]